MQNLYEKILEKWFYSNNEKVVRLNDIKEIFEATNESVPAETLVMPMFAEVINNFGEECPYCDNSGQIIHGYSGDSSKDLEMCEFCYTTQNSKFNLYCEIEKVLNASKHSV